VLGTLTRRRSVPRRDRRWTAVAGLGLLAAAFGLGAAPAADAQAPSDLTSQFGGFTTEGRGNGLQLTYNVENVFPIPAPLFQASVPEASTTLQSGPTSAALGSVAYPGSLLANLPSVIAQSSPEFAAFVPPYPIQTKAEYPAGPPEARQDVGSATATVAASDVAAESVTTMAGGDLPPFVRIGTITTAARSALLEGSLESRSRVELNGVDLFFGLMHIDSVVTDLVATSDGTVAASDGGTTVSGVTFLGLPATIGPGGVEVGQPSAPEDPGPLTPVVDGAGDLTPVGEALGSAVEPLNQAMEQVLGTTNASVQDLLGASGITIRTFEPFESVDGASAERTANGLIIEMNYDGQGDNPLAQLLGAIPAEDLPGEGIPGFPLNTSPQALVNLMKETHVTGLALAYGNVNVNASPAFEFTPPSFTTPNLGSGLTPPGSSTVPLPGFSTPTPALPSSGGTGTAPVNGSLAGAAGGAGAVAVVFALLSSPLWAIGSRNLADNVLGMASSSCPEGLDAPGGGG